MRILEAATIVTAILVSVAPVRADPIVDQSFLSSSWSWLALLNSHSSAAQTFTVGSSGVLTGVDLALGKHHALPATGVVTVAVHSTQAGVPAGPLVAASLNPMDIPVQAFNATQPFGVASLRGLSLRVEAGDTLALVLATTGDYYAWAGAFSAYPRGGAFGRHCEEVPCASGWLPFSDAADERDFMFRTYVSPAAPVPEPPAFALVGLGLASASFARWRQRAHSGRSATSER